MTKNMRHRSDQMATNANIGNANSRDTRNNNPAINSSTDGNLTTRMVEVIEDQQKKMTPTKERTNMPTGTGLGSGMIGARYIADTEGRAEELIPTSTHHIHKPSVRVRQTGKNSQKNQTN